jgi:hypothetical protein
MSSIDHVKLKEFTVKVDTLHEGGKLDDVAYKLSQAYLALAKSIDNLAANDVASERAPPSIGTSSKHMPPPNQPRELPDGNAEKCDLPPADSATDKSPSPTNGQQVSVNGGGSNSLRLENNTDYAMPVAFFRNLAPGEHPSFNGPEAEFVIAPHASLDLSMPDDWQGRVQKWSGDTQTPSNWAEINFEKSTGKIWFDESDIPGRNASIKIQAPDGASAGSELRVLSQAPADIVTTDSAGHKVIKPPQWFEGKTNQQSVDFLNKNLGNQNAYILPDDNNAVRTSQSKSLTIKFGDA